MNELDIIIPVINEAGNIEELARRIDHAMRQARISYQMIFVDDRSTDATVKEIMKVSEKYPVILHHKQGKQGKAYSILEGARLATAEYVVMIDGDLQYPPETIPAMYKLTKDYGVVVANRKVVETSRLRRLATKVNNYIFGKLLLRFGVDTQSGLKIFKREIADHLDESQVSGWTIDMHILQIALDLGLTIGCVEIDFEARRNGSSKIRFFRDTIEIASAAAKLKFCRKRVYPIKPTSKSSSIGAGFVHKRRKFITHTGLDHKHSALKTLSAWQELVIIALLLLLITGFVVSVKWTVILFVAALSSVYFADVIFSLYVLLKSLHFPPELKFSKKELKNLDESKLPVYTILCPLYKESKVLSHFLESIDALDWPKNKLDVMLLLEEDDQETIDAAKKINPPKYVKTVVVPHSFPKTKPKACNYGLAKARGEYVVIYDAEDRPDPSQLKKAYLGFNKSGPKTFCLQSKLNYYNPNHNLLTRLFTAEYSLWFDVILPGLQSIEATIPLGGTSNHFRTKDLKGLHAWDPFNVTEDCDLGVRLFKKGYKTAIIDSTTLEEANSKLGNWLRQRSRWIKGYFQTFFVHMRDPVDFLKSHGRHALVFQLVVGMRMTFMLINPLLWLATLGYFTLYSLVGPAIESLYPAPVFYIASFSLVVGNFMYVYNYMIGCAKRRHWGLVKYVFLIPFYWLLASLAAMKALYQLLVKPHYWEKTQHGFHLSHEEKRRKLVGIGHLKNLAGSGIFSAGALVFSSGISSVFNFGYNAYLGRVVSLEEFGLVSLISNFFALAGVIVTALNKTVTYRSAYLLGKLGRPIKEFWQETNRAAFVASLGIVIIWLLSTPILKDFFNAESILPFILFTPFWLVALVGAVNLGFLSGSLKFITLSTIILVESVSKLLFAVLLVETSLTKWVYVAIPLSSIVSFVIGWMAVARIKTKALAQRHESIKKFPKAFFASASLVKLSSDAFLSLDVIMAKHYLLPKQAGEYALLSFSGKIVFFLGALFSQFIVPLVSRDEGAKADSKKTFYPLFLATTLASMTGLLAVGVFGNWTIPILFGEKARSILSYVFPFSLAMMCFSVANAIVTFNQVRKRHLFPAVGFMAATLELVGISQIHSSVADITGVVLLLSIGYFLTVLTLHLIYHPLVVLTHNFADLLGLFSKVPRASGKKGALKILVLNWRDTKHVWAGGAEVYVHELAKAWIARGHKVTLFCGNDGKSKRNEVVEGVQVVRRGGFYTVYIWAFLYYTLRFRGKYDVIVESENGIPFFTPFYSRKPKLLIVHHVHQEVFRNHLRFPLSTVARFIESRLMPFVYRNQNVVAVSESTKKEVIRLGLAKRDNISVVNPGVNVTIGRKPRKTRNPSFVYMGRHKAYKNIEVAIAAFSKVVVAFPKACLIIAGDGEETDKLKSQARKLKVSKSVEFLGRVSEKRKAEILAKSWVAIQPSSFEGWGITVLEANSFATPIIASDVNGLRDSVVDGITGILVPAKNVDIFAKVMIELARDSDFRKELSEGAFQWAQKFSWEKKAEEFLNIVNKLLADSKSFSVSPDHLVYAKEEEI